MKNSSHSHHRASGELAQHVAHSNYHIKYTVSPDKSYLVCPASGEISYPQTEIKSKNGLDSFVREMSQEHVVKFEM
jgi:hypothetical protein